jgi:hypothetical protein
MFKPLRFAVLLAGVTLAVSAWAQPAPEDDQDQSGDQQAAPAADPPTRVARLAYLNGDVSFVPAGENDWVEAQLNRPLITGDKLWTDRGSRAELNIGEASLRIDQNTSFDFLNLDDNVAQVELTQGSLNLHVRRLYDNQTYEIDTPTLAFVVNRVGDFRIDVLPNGQSTVVTVQQGAGDAYGEGGARFRIEEGQSVTFNDAQLQDYESADVPRPDDFDNFTQQRDHRWDNAKSRQYVSEEVIGYEDLDDNGEWSDVPEYGNVWYPTTVAVGWAPYHHGHWGWVGAYGWTWIDEAPWGFAPFHYGRWANIGGRWGWCPGPRHERAVYAPALVAFVGGGVSVGVSGPVGWFPLGPRDVYFPSYRVSERYFGRVNISNSRGFTSVTINNYYGGYRSGHIDYEHISYSNRNINGAITAVPREAFVSARPVAREAVVVNREMFANSRVSAVAAVAPTRASLVATSRVARAAPPAAVLNRQIVAASKPPAAVVPFAQRQAQLERNPGRPLPVTELHRGSVAGGANAAAGGNAALATRPNVRVVTNTGAPVRAAAPALPARGVGAQNGGVNGRGQNPNAMQGNRNLPAVQNQQNNAAGVNGAGRPGPQGNRNLPAVQNQQNNAAGVNGAGRPMPQGNRNLPAVQNQNDAAANNGRPGANQHLDSSRFAHPQNGAQGGNPNVAGPRGGANPQVQSVERPAAGPRYTPAEHAQQNNPANAANAHQPPPNVGRPNVEPRGADARNAGAAGNPNAYSRDAGNGGRNVGGGAQSRPEYRAPVQQQQQQQHVESAHVQQPPQQHVESARVQQPAPQQQYHAESRQQPQYRQPQAPVQQQQPQYRAAPPQPQPQQQYHAPANAAPVQSQQMQRQAPPPPQQHAQPQPNRPAPQPKDKKDDDKRH